MDEFEARLSEFKPRRPGPLPRRSKTRPAVWFALTAAAAAALMVVAGRIPRKPSPSSSQPEAATVGALTALALSDPGALDAALTRMSRTVLPDVEQPDRALSALGKESR